MEMERNDCYLTEEQKLLLREIAKGLESGLIRTQWYRLSPLNNWNGLPTDIGNQLTAEFLKILQLCGFIRKDISPIPMAQEKYLIEKHKILNIVKNNFGESMEQPKPQKSYKGLSEEQWNFLKVLSTALKTKQISADNKGGKGFYIKPIPNDEANVVEIKGIKKQFWDVNRKKLSISMDQIFELVGLGFLEIAPMNNFYLKEEEIHEGTKYYESLQNTNIILGTPNTSSQFHCDIFMVMPFRDGLNDVYENIIVPVSHELSLSIKRGDERQRASASIVDEVLAYLKSAKIILVDCTEIDEKPNGNVYYELGYADALGHDNVILISQTDATTLPFDVRHRGVIHYKDNAKGLGKLRDELKKEFQSILGS